MELIELILEYPDGPSINTQTLVNKQGQVRKRGREEAA